MDTSFFGVCPLVLLGKTCIAVLEALSLLHLKVLNVEPRKGSGLAELLSRSPVESSVQSCHMALVLQRDLHGFA